MPSAASKGVGAYGAATRGTDATKVDDFHQNSDADARSESQHHTLGANQNQAAAGNHTHDGGTSSFLWSGVTITGSRGGNMAVASIISALVAKGATDASTS
jgi:ABC-type Zn2+ transport system substrate-binding protein/surface adhesin